jgi:hypothetical protein
MSSRVQSTPAAIQRFTPQQWSRTRLLRVIVRQTTTIRGKSALDLISEHYASYQHRSFVPGADVRLLSVTIRQRVIASIRVRTKRLETAYPARWTLLGDGRSAAARRQQVQLFGEKQR